MKKEDLKTGMIVETRDKEKVYKLSDAELWAVAKEGVKIGRKSAEN